MRLPARCFKVAARFLPGVGDWLANRGESGPPDEAKEAFVVDPARDSGHENIVRSRSTERAREAERG